MSGSNLPQAARYLDEAAKLEALSILEAAERDAEELEAQAHSLGVSQSVLDFAPGDRVLEFAAATRTQGRENAAKYLFRSRAQQCFDRLKPDVEAFMAETDRLWYEACQECHISAPKLSEESKRELRIRALHAVADSLNTDQTIQPSPEETKKAKTGGRPSGTLVDGPKLQEWRGGFTQEDFAEKCGVSVATIQRGEAGGRWDQDTFDKVAETIGMLTEKPITSQDLKNLRK
jgi:DNA-binding XRE family transcriptional regulator